MSCTSEILTRNVVKELEEMSKRVAHHTDVIAKLENRIALYGETIDVMWRRLSTVEGITADLSSAENERFDRVERRMAKLEEETPLWEASKVYREGDAVLFNGIVYTCVELKNIDMDGCLVFVSADDLNKAELAKK